jgi:hypothetical protein
MQQLMRPETSSSAERLFASLLLVPRPESPRPGPSLGVFSHRVVFSHQTLGPVHRFSRNRSRLFEPDAARQILQPCQREAEHTNERQYLTRNDAFARLVARPDRSRPSRERYGTETSSFEKAPAGAPKAPAVPAEKQ